MSTAVAGIQQPLNLDDIAIRRPRVQGIAIVKSVLSGDTLILAGSATSNNGTPLEKRIRLAHITAPQLAGFGVQQDEPLAYDAREFLRSKVQGKVVEFIFPFISIDQASTVGGSKAVEFADVTFNGDNLSELMVCNGYARVNVKKFDDSTNDGSKKKGSNTSTTTPAKLSSEQEHLLTVEKQAKQNKLGIHGKDIHRCVRDIKYNPNAIDIYNEYSKKTVTVYVDRVLDGSTVRVEIPHLQHDQKYQQYSTVVNLSGIIAPRTRDLKGVSAKDVKHSATTIATLGNKDDGSEDDNYHPIETNITSAHSNTKQDVKQLLNTYALMAKQFVEQRLLYKTITMTVDSIDSRNNIYVTFIHPTKGNIAELLLAQGLGRYASWTAAALSTELRSTLSKAATTTTNNLAKLGGSSIVSAPSLGIEYEAKVVHIANADSVVIELPDGITKKVYFSLITTPRFKRKENVIEPWAFEARDFLRRSLIGRTVRVVVDHQITKNKGRKLKNHQQQHKDVSPAREYVTMYKGKYNIAHELVANGYADVLMFNKDQPRLDSYHELYLAECKAKAEHKHKHGKKIPLTSIPNLSPSIDKKDSSNKKDGDEIKPVPPKMAQKKSAIGNTNSDDDIIDTMSPSNIQAFKAMRKLQREKDCVAVLDAVFTPTKYRLFIPSLQAYIDVSLSGVQAPIPSKDDKTSMTVITEAMQYLRPWVQYEFTLELLSTSRTTFLVNLINRTTKQVVNVDMVAKGYCSVIHHVANRSRYKLQLFQAETSAKKSRVGIWVNYDEEKERLEMENARKEAANELGDDGIFTKDGQSYLHVIVTDVADSVHFYTNTADHPHVKLVKERMLAFNGDSVTITPELFTPQVGDIVAGLFDDDKQWHRVRIERHRKTTNTYDVQFIDYGNLTTLPYASLRPLPQDLLKIKQLARPCRLSGVKAPLATSEFFEIGANVFAGLVVNKRFLARMDLSDHRANGIIHLTLFPTDGDSDDSNQQPKLSINQQLVQYGLIRIDPRPPFMLKEMIANELSQYEQEAQYERRNIYQYGDYTSDVEDD